MRLTRSAAAELVKLRGLPAVWATTLGTIAAAIALATAFAASTPDPANAVPMTLATIPFLQVGLILLGVLAVATEYQGSQIRTSLTATPNRSLLLAGKAMAFLTVAAITSAAAVGAALVAASITLAGRETAPAGDVNGWHIVGAGGYLVLIGLLALALTVLLRSLIPPLVTMLTLVLIVSPLLAGITEHARWLPDQAGRLLYLPDADPALTAGTGTGTGTLILLAWTTVAGVAAAARLLTRDA